MTVLENIALAPIQVKKYDQQRAQNESVELLRRVGLEDKADVRPDSLSGGQKWLARFTASSVVWPKKVWPW